MNYGKATPIERELLPLLSEYSTYKVKHRTCSAVFQPVEDEIRISSVMRKEPGDFKELMDRLVEDLDHSTVRFVSVDRNTELQRLWDRITPDNSRTIQEAVHGFSEETVYEYTTEDGEVEPVGTLIGEWQP